MSLSFKERLGIFGGTFSPPHRGHVSSAEDFLREAKLDRLLVIPTFLPPHKEIDFYASPDDRLAMCRLAFGGLPKTEVSDIELVRGGKSYTADTLSALAAPDRELFMLCGTDMFLTLDSWYCPEIVFSLATVCFVRRENDPENLAKIDEKSSLYREKYGAKLLPVPHGVTEISSSQIRRELENRAEASAYLSSEVLSYIRERGLYRDGK